MFPKSAWVIWLTALMLSWHLSPGQIPVELMGGNKKVTLDVMFFKYIKNKSGLQSRFLFFNRNRVSVDYRMTSNTNLPSFGCTEAISYNHETFKGFAPVFVAQALGSGVYSKVGIQYSHIKGKVTLFSWLVCETKFKPRLDLFFLGRFTPALSEKLNWFCQIELLHTLPTMGYRFYSFTQRIRLGLKRKEYQIGLGADFSETGRTNLLTSSNIGGFFRYEF